ncbi:MAG: hypothetical protein LC789_08390 [Actinobacteria bacterium]|nr:hypothetical protein [Actinomycetota bacterium]MCA1720526.1 hypothetical protein [Actinomycetota bacterium]
MDDLNDLFRTQGGVISRRQAVAVLGRSGVAAALRDRWVRVGGAYTSAAHHAALDADGRHLIACAARVLRSGGTAYVSHESAAVAHRIPLLDRPEVPQITIDTPGHATSGGVRGRHLADLPSADRTSRGGLALTTAPRTVSDLARTLSAPAAFVAVEGSLRAGVDLEDVRAVLLRCRRWPGVVAARRVLELASPWSESALESLGMHWCRLQELPAPQQQLTIRTTDGRFLARVDQLWEEHATVGELDGRIKLQSDDEVPRNAWRVAWEEKQREDRLRDVGLQVARGYWSDQADDGAEYAARIRRAFERASHYAGPRLYVVRDERRPRLAA